MTRGGQADAMDGGNRLGALGLWLVAAAGTVWWVAMWAVPSWRPLFRAGDVPDAALLSLGVADLPLFVGGNALAGFLLRHRPDSPWCERFVWLALGATLYPTLFVVAETLRTGGQGWAGAMAMLAATALVSLVAWATRPGGKAFEPASERPPWLHQVLTALYSAFFWGMSLGLGPWLLIRAEAALGVAPLPLGVPRVLCLMLGLASAALNLWSGAAMSTYGEGTPLPQDTARRLVVRGPYRFIRNPMAASGVGMVLCLGLGLRSWSVVVAALGTGLVWHFGARPPEEADLLDRFGYDYAAYRRAVPLWRFRLPPVPPS